MRVITSHCKPSRLAVGAHSTDKPNENDCSCASVTPPGRPQAVTPPPRRNDLLAQMIGGRWESKNMRNLFAPNSPHDVGVDVILNSHIDLLEAMINEPKVLVENVEKTEEDSELTYENMFYIEKKATYLRQAFTIAIEYMPDKTWQQCCEEAIQELARVEINKISS